MKTRSSRSRTRRPVANKACTKCPGCNTDDRCKPKPVNSEETDHKRKRSQSVDHAPRRRARSSTRGRKTDSPPTTHLSVTNQLVISDEAASTSTANKAPSGITRAFYETMKISTKSYCLFCLKLRKNVMSGVDGGEEADPINRKELCSRFVKLLSRHLGLDIYKNVATTSNHDGTFFAKTIKQDEGFFDIVACEACFTICKSFCDAYEIYKKAELELGWNVLKLRDIMKSAEKVPSRSNDFRRNVLEGMESQERELMDGFKREFFSKCNRVKGYPKLVLKKFHGKHEKEIKRPATIGLQQFHRSTPIDMVKNPTASIQVLELGDELILTSRARAPPRSKSVPPISTKTPAKSTFRTPVSTPRKASLNSTPGKSNPIISKSAHVETIPKKSSPVISKSAHLETIPKKSSPVIPKPAHVETIPNKSNPVISKPDHVETVLKKSKLRDDGSTQPGPSSRTDPHKNNRKVMHVTKRVPTPSPQKNITPQVIDLCDSDDEGDSGTSKASPPKKAKTSTSTSVPVIAEPEPLIAEAAPQPTSGESSRSMEVNEEDNTGKDTGTALVGNQDDNEIVMGVCSQSAPQPCEDSTSNIISSSVSQTPENSGYSSTSCYFTPPQEPSQPGSPDTNENEIAGFLPHQMNTQTSPEPLTNEFPYYSPHPQSQFEEQPNTPQYDYNYADAPPEATGTFDQHHHQPQPMDFEFPSPAPGTGIEFNVDHVPNGPEMYRISYTYTRTVTSTFNGIPPGNFPMPHPHISQEVPRQPPFCHETQDHVYDQTFDYNDYVPQHFNATSENHFGPHPNEPIDPQPIVTEVDDGENYNLNQNQSQEVAVVAIAEIDDDSDDIQVIEEVCTGPQRGLTVTIQSNLTNESEINKGNNDMRNNMETITPPVYACT